MADNTVINAGTGGDTIATDDIAGVKYQRTKVTFGADGSATDVSSASPLPVDSELPAAAALADATSNPTTPAVGAFGQVFNGTTWDRLRTAVADAQAGTGLSGAGNMVWNGSSWDRLKEPTADTAAATGVVSAGGMIWNGTTFDRWKGAFGDNASGNGIPFVMGGALTAGGGFDKLRESHSDGQAVTGIAAAGNMLYNGSTWDRLRGMSGGAYAVPLYVELTGSASALNGDAIASTDVRGYQSFSIVLTGTWTATVKVQGSNDNANWEDLYFYRISSISSVSTTISTTNQVFVGGISTRYLRVRITSYTSGTVSAVLELSAAPMTPTIRRVQIENSSAISVSSTPATSASSVGDGTSGGSLAPGAQYAYVGGTLYDRLRTANVFKTVAVTASGNTALWTPTSGKKFRLMRYRLEVTSDAAVSGGGLMTIKMQDATTDTAVAHSLYCPAVSGTAFGTDYQPGWVDLSNGILSAAANNVLNINLSVALTSGTCRVMCAGTEE